MVNSKKNQTKLKGFKLSLIFRWTALPVQPETQIRYRKSMKMQVPVIGKIEMISTTVVANGIVHEKEESNIDRFIFRWMDYSEGSIIDQFNGYMISYDNEEQEYWHTTFHIEGRNHG